MNARPDPRRGGPSADEGVPRRRVLHRREREDEARDERARKREPPPERACTLGARATEIGGGERRELQYVPEHVQADDDGPHDRARLVHGHDPAGVGAERDHRHAAAEEDCGCGDDERAEHPQHRVRRAGLAVAAAAQVVEREAVARRRHLEADRGQQQHPDEDVGRQQRAEGDEREPLDGEERKQHDADRRGEAGVAGRPAPARGHHVPVGPCQQRANAVPARVLEPGAHRLAGCVERPADGRACVGSVHVGRDDTRRYVKQRRSSRKGSASARPMLSRRGGSAADATARGQVLHSHLGPVSSPGARLTYGRQASARSDTVPALFRCGRARSVAVRRVCFAYVSRVSCHGTARGS